MKQQQQISVATVQRIIVQEFGKRGAIDRIDSGKSTYQDEMADIAKRHKPNGLPSIDGSPRYIGITHFDSAKVFETVSAAQRERYREEDLKKLTAIRQFEDHLEEDDAADEAPSMIRRKKAAVIEEPKKERKPRQPRNTNKSLLKTAGKGKPAKK